MWLARYLGPEKFGLLNYAIAFVALFGPVSTLGIQGVVIRDIVKDPGAKDVTLGSSFALRLAGGLALAAWLAWLFLHRRNGATAGPGRSGGGFGEYDSHDRPGGFGGASSKNW